MMLQRAFTGILALNLVLLCTNCSGQTSAPNVPEPKEQAGAKGSFGRPAQALGERILVIYQDTSGAHWFAGGAEGVYRYDGENLRLFTTDDGLAGIGVLSIQEDKQGRVYFDTAAGVSRYDGASFETLPLADDNQVSLWRLEPGDLWFRMGWDGEGPYRYDGHVLHSLQFPKPKQAYDFEERFPNVSFSPYGVYTIYQDRRGAVWFGTSSLGAARYDGKTLSWIYEEAMTNTPSGGTLGIRSVLEDSRGDYWFTNTRYRYVIQAGATERDRTIYQNYTRKPGVAAPNVKGDDAYPYFMSIAEDKQGHLWMATYDEGVWRNDGASLTHYPVKYGKKQVLLFATYVDQAGTLWLGSHNAGALKWNGQAFVRFTP